MILKDYLKAGKKILANNVSSIVRQFYDVETIPWLSSDYIDVYERTIKAKYSLREMFVEDESEVNELTELMMLSNFDKYKHIYDLLLEEYNPLWNVDGTEITTRTLTGQNSRNSSGTNATTYNTTDERTIEDVTTHNTTDALTGNDSTTYGKTITETNDDSRTTYDSNTYYGTDTNEKATTEGGTDRGTKSESTTHTGTDRNDVSDTNEHTGTDTTTKTETGTDSQSISERIANERHGNIGVTSTVHLMTEDIEFSDKYRKFINMVCVDLVREITLSC